MLVNNIFSKQGFARYVDHPRISLSAQTHYDTGHFQPCRPDGSISYITGARRGSELAMAAAYFRRRERRKQMLKQALVVVNPVWWWKRLRDR